MGVAAGQGDGVEHLVSFRRTLREVLTSWGDALFELGDAVLCGSGRVASVPALSLEPEFSRSHGSLYKALSQGRVEEGRLRRLLVANRPAGWPLVFAVDASTFDRCDAETSPERGVYYSASKHSAGQPIVAGWNYQWICQLDWAPDSWTAPLDVARIPPRADSTTATVTQLRRLVDLLPADGEVPLFVFDAGYDAIAIGHDSRTAVSRFSVASAMTASSTPRRLPARTGHHTPAAALPDTDNAGSAPTPPPGRLPRRASPPPTPATATSPSPPGTASTRGCPDADTAQHRTHRRSWRAARSASRSSTSPRPPPARRRRCGCGGPAKRNPTSTGAGGPTCGASTSSTHSDS